MYGQDYIHYLPQFVPCPYPAPSWGFDDTVCPSCSRNLVRTSNWPYNPGGSGFGADGNAEDFLGGRIGGWLGRPLD